jgi:hypothetical protein
MKKLIIFVFGFFMFSCSTSQDCYYSKEYKKFQKQKDSFYQIDKQCNKKF